MKKIFLLFIITLPITLSAQYSGGNGRGDASCETSGLILEIKENQLSPGFALLQNIPNPVTEITSITAVLPYKVKMKIVLYDILGRQMKILVEESMGPGKFSFKMNVEDLESGLYFYRMTAGDFTSARSMEVK